MAAPLSLIVSDEQAARDTRLIIDDFADPAASHPGTRWMREFEVDLALGEIALYE